MRKHIKRIIGLAAIALAGITLNVKAGFISIPIPATLATVTNAQTAVTTNNATPFNLPQGVQKSHNLTFALTVAVVGPAPGQPASTNTFGFNLLGPNGVHTTVPPLLFACGATNTTATTNTYWFVINSTNVNGALQGAFEYAQTGAVSNNVSLQAGSVLWDD